MASSNIGDVMEFLRDFVEGFDFTRPGRDQSLGRDLAHAQVDQIMTRSSKFQSPDGSQWTGNSTSPWRRYPQGYKQWKEEQYGWDDAPNYRTGQMLSQLSLFGRTRIEPRQITLIYGIEAAPTRSASPNGHLNLETDGKVTDVQKATWAHGGEKGKPARPFYGVGDGDAEALCAVAREALHEYIRSSPYSQG